MCNGPFCDVCGAEILDETCGAWDPTAPKHNCAESLNNLETYHLTKALEAREKRLNLPHHTR